MYLVETADFTPGDDTAATEPEGSSEEVSSVFFFIFFFFIIITLKLTIQRFVTFYEVLQTKKMQK